MRTRPWSSGRGVCPASLAGAVGSVSQPQRLPGEAPSAGSLLSGPRLPRPDPAWNSRGFSICIFQARELCTPSSPVWMDNVAFLLFRNARKCCCVLDRCVKSLRGRQKSVSCGPPSGLWGAVARQCLCLAWDGGRGGRPVHLASGAETPGHAESWMFTVRHKSLSPALSFSLSNYAVLWCFWGV